MNKLIGPATFYQRALKIALPIMFQLLIQSLISLIDNFMVAGLGDIKMASINVANQINMIYFVLINSLCSAGGIFISQYNGIKDKEGMQQAFRFKVLMCSVVSILYIYLCVFHPGKLMGFMLKNNTEKEAIIGYGITYLKISAITWIPIAISTSIGSAMRESENVKTPLYISIAATLVNTFFNWVFIYGNLGCPRLEIAGAAIATCIARFVELISYFVYCYIKKPLFFAKIYTIFKIKASLFSSMLKKSGLIVAGELSWILTETVMNRIYNGRGGSDIVAGMAASWSIANLFQLVISGVATSTGVIIGGTLGKGELQEAKKQATWMKSGAFLAGLFVGILESCSIFLIPVVFGNLSDNAHHISRNMLFVISAYLPIWTFLNAQFSVARAGGDAVMGTVVDVSVNSLLFLPGIILLGHFTTWNPVLMFAVIKITDIVKSIIAEIQLHKERWVKNLTVQTEAVEKND